jgi:hypothetical protein
MMRLYTIRWSQEYVGWPGKVECAHLPQIMFAEAAAKSG